MADKAPTSSSPPAGTTLRQVLGQRLATLRDIKGRRDRGEAVSLSIPTGLRSWDEIGGIERGILTVIGAATGDGKSVVALHLACAAARAGLRVLLLSFEDPAAKTADRLFSTETGINSKHIGKLDFDDIDMEQLAVALAGAAWADNIRVVAGLRTAEEVLTMFEGDYDLILLDYVQALSELPGKTMEETIRKVSWVANAAAQKTNAAIVFFSQLNREVESRGRKMFDAARMRDPTACCVEGFCPSGLTDIAWAKALADQCKCLLYVWRPNRMAKKLTGSNKIKDDRLRIIAGKVSFAEEKDLEFEFDGPTATIRDKRD